MAATQTVVQRARLRNSATPSELKIPKGGVITLVGYGIRVRVDRGHLILEDGIGSDRRCARLPRVGHGLRRLVVVGNDGVVSLAALRWLADQDAAFVMLERNGKVLVTTGPVSPSDARLRRTQALAVHSGVALQITRELIDKKIAAQEQVARDKLRDSALAETVGQFRKSVVRAVTLHEVHMLESAAAGAYWLGWQKVSATFPSKDLPRVPEHWKSFRTRHSLISGSPRVACDPINSMLNYLYALLEAETRLAITALGLDPGLGFFHRDSPSRDSLASDLMEPVRPQVDSFVLDWVARSPLKREWFFEEHNGNCRLMASLTSQLSETAVIWRSAVAPFAEWVVHVLWKTTRKSPSEAAPATRLTQGHKREAKGAPQLPSEEQAPEPQNICEGCGVRIRRGRKYCVPCGVVSSKERLIEAAKKGRTVANRPENQASRSKKMRTHTIARWGWSAASQPAWLTGEFYEMRIQPLLANFPRSAIMDAIGISKPYAAQVRTGRCIPHPRHWRKLAELVGVPIKINRSSV